LHLVSSSQSPKYGFNTENQSRLGEKTDEVSLILIPLLLAIFGVYIGLSGGHSYVALKLRKAKQSWFVTWIFVANGFLCGCIAILAIILLGVGAAQVISADRVLWVS
jgi:hypothetical protein